jgi:hypothetical protein
MQIMADLFGDRSGEGPVMMLWDKMPGLANKEKTHYGLRQQDSPAVARFVRGGCIPLKRDLNGLEEELEEDLFLDKKRGRYWLEGMVFCLRREEVVSKE